MVRMNDATTSLLTEHFSYTPLVSRFVAVPVSDMRPMPLKSAKVRNCIVR